MRAIALFIPILLALFACNQSNSGSISASKDAAMVQSKPLTDPPESFMQFYQQFHTDSLYQIRHISWPLTGQGEVQVDSVNFKKVLKEWSPGTWKIHHSIDFSMNTEFKREFEIVGDAMIIEHIRLRSPQLKIGQERRFFQNETGEWQLIYYGELQHE